MANGDAGDIYAYNTAQRRVAKWLHQLVTYGYIGAKPISAGRLDNRMKSFAKANGIEVSSSHLYIPPEINSPLSTGFEAAKTSCGFTFSTFGFRKKPLSV